MKRKKILMAMVVAIIAVTSVAQIDAQVNKHRPKLKPEVPVQRPIAGGGAQFGDALFGLDALNLQAFVSGRTEFEAVETPEGGLGPIFNSKSCAGCHFSGATGGASGKTVTRFGRLENGQFNALENLGGSLLQQFAIAPEALEHVPAQANVIARRITTPLFGAGLIEAISDQDILLNAQRRQPDGVHGRAAMITDISSGNIRVGRFGWKAQQASLLAFSGDAYLNEMGITNRLFPTENAPNGNQTLLAKYDKVRDIEDTVDPFTGKGDIDHAMDFMRFLAAPPQLRLSVSATAGGKIFEQIKCTACHIPNMHTANNTIAALSNKTVALFSDLLLHDMGLLGDGIEQAAAKGKEIRTAPLWGLRARGPYLHDGRAKTIAEAIRAHDGEATPSRTRFTALKPIEVQQMLDYLNAI